MKTKTYLFLILIGCCSGLANAQSWLQDDKAWVYNWGWWGKGGYKELTTLPGETTINGMTCKQLNVRLQYVYYNSENDTYHIIDEQGWNRTICQSGDSIFSLNISGEFELEYDFSLEPGDSFLFYNDNIPLYKLTLESVGMEVIQNQTLRTQQFKAHLLSSPGTENLDGMSFKFIETIGMVESSGGWNQISYLFPTEVFHAGADYPHHSLRCALGPDYEYKLVDDCYGLVLGTDELDPNNSGIEISPNPADVAIRIQHKSGTIEGTAKIYSMNGQLKFATNQLNEPIRVDYLPKGVYLVVVENGQGIFRQNS
ncbi:MAG: T9SS type A sorting domain-containing protein [Saprospiraceae bacterium]|nr:T9SS type A sorting domain-containing protein [Saprospiraceae bacterium]